MSKGIVYKLFSIHLLVILSLSKVYSQDQKINSIRLMSYNVENLFDIYDDTLTEDNDFLPGGLMRWNFTRYNRKINSLYKTIIAAGSWDPPAVIALCEIENRKVLEDLSYGTNLLKYNYGILHEDSPDERGIDVSLIYRKDLVRICFFRFWIPSNTGHNEFTSRSILYAKCCILKDTIHLFVNHLPSRRGGVLAGENDRIVITSLIRSKVDSIAAANPRGAKIIITGDFNCTPDDPVVKRLTAANKSGIALINLTDSLSHAGFGTYRYAGTWEMIDQIIVSECLINSKTRLSSESKNLTIFKPDFLIRNDPNYPGLSPFATYRGFRYQGGTSDHLPLLLDLIIR
jgi:hypothetical protein